MASFELTGTILLGSVMLFVAQVVLALRISTLAVWVPLPSPVSVILTGWGVEAALTSFTHAFDFAVIVAETKNLIPVPDSSEDAI